MSLPSGFSAGSEVFWAAWNNTTRSGAIVKYGTAGVVVQAVEGESGVIVKFGDVLLTAAPEKLAKTQPCLQFASGYELDDTVFFIGSTQIFGGTKLESGTEGVVVGDTGSRDLVAVKFPVLKAVVKLGLPSVSKHLPKAVKMDGRVALGTYVGHGALDGCDCSCMLELKEKNLFCLQYKTQPPVKDMPAETVRAAGSFAVTDGEVKITFGGLPGVGRHGQVWEFAVDARSSCLLRQGLKLFLQTRARIDVSEPGAIIGAPPAVENKLQLGTYISADFKRTPQGKNIADTCYYTITLVPDNQLWLDFETHSTINSSKWHVEGTYEETFGKMIQYKIEKRQGGGPALGSVLTLDMDVARSIIVFDGVNCKFQGKITAVDPDMKAVQKAEPKATSTPVAGATLTLTLAQLQDDKVWRVKGVHPAARETHLSDSEFEVVFGMSKAVFKAMPPYKKEIAKKKHGLF